jgi:hypothetical protein
MISVLVAGDLEAAALELIDSKLETEAPYRGRGAVIHHAGLNAILPCMELSEAKAKADLLLDQERIRPTVSYNQVPFNWPDSPEVRRLLGLTAPPTVGKARVDLFTQRKGFPRQVNDDPENYKFTSANYEYLILIFNQVRDEDRADFVAHIIRRVTLADSALGNQLDYIFPSFDRKVSELPLVAEFAIRTGHADRLLEAAAKATMMSRSLVILLMHLEDIIAVNFNLFSEEQLQGLPLYFTGLLQRAESQMNNSMIVGAASKRIAQSIQGIREECEQGRYLYLTGALRQLPNLEIDQDKKKIEGYLTKLGFTGEMAKVLDAAETDYRSTSTPFELKNCLSHLRSFLEHLHRISAQALAKKAGATVTDRWGDATLYLRTSGVLTKQHESFVTSLYTLISDESVHPLGTAQEYARLLRNVVIEYGVMFLSVLDQKGVKITP